MRVGTGSGRYVYPDLSVFCGAAQLTEDGLTLLNAVLVVEVTSPTSMGYDRYTKLDYYRAMRTLESYIIVAQDECHVEMHSRSEGGCHWQTFSAIDDVIPLTTLSCSLPLPENYRGIVFSDD